MKPEAVSAPVQPDLSLAFSRAWHCGWKAASQMLLPAAVIQSLMLLLVLSYYLHWPVNLLLETLANWQRESATVIPHGEMVFGFVSSGLAGGVFAEAFKVYFVQKGRWTRINLNDACFKFLLIGLGGSLAGFVYTLQAMVFGNDHSVRTVICKVLVDQFLYNPILAAPLPCVINHWMNQGLTSRTFQESFTLRFYIDRVFPLLLSTWVFWIPMVSLIYSLPVPLQFPLFLSALTMWGLIFTSLVNLD